MDSYSFTSLARLRFQIVPVNKLSSDKFTYYFKELQRLQEVRLSDLSPVQGLFNPQGYPQGRIVFNFSSVADAESLLLHDFEPHRKTFGCIGILQWNKDLDVNAIQNAKDELDKLYGSLISNYLLVFGADESNNLLPSIPNVYYLKDIQVLETIICDLTSNFLEKLSVYVSSFQHVTLRSPGSIVRSNGKPTVDAPTSRKISGSFEINSSEKSKLARNNGRRLKLFANFYLLTGKFKDALMNICDSIVLLKQVSDNLWLASALECLAVCIMLLSYLEAPFSLPQGVTSIIESTKDTPFVGFRSPSPASSPRASMQSVASSTTGNAATNASSTQTQPPLQQYTLEAQIELISKIINKAFFYYKMTVHQGDEQVPMIVFIESNLRYTILLTAIHVEGTFNFQIIRNTVNPRHILSDKSHESRDDLNVSQILDSISNIFGQGFKNISVSQKCSVYNCLIFVYTSLKMERKKAFILKELLDIINSARLLDSKDIEYNEITSILEYLIAAYKVTSKEGSFIMQKRILILIFNFCGKLENKDGVIKYGSLLLKCYHDSLTDDEQVAIFKRLKYYSNKSGVSCQYWDQQLLSTFEISNTKNSEFIQGESIDAVVFLRNPFAFDIEISNLEVSTFKNFSLKTIVNPKSKGGPSSAPNDVNSSTILRINSRSISQVPLCLIPLDEGKLIIDGIKCEVSNCENQIFLFQASTTSGIERVKQNQNDSTTEAFNHSNVPQSRKVLEFDVLYKQPVLSIVDVRLDDRWFMLLEGECKKFEVRLKNISDVEINQMTLSFIDSTVEPLQALLTNKNIPPNEVYEIEYYLFKKQAFKILNKHEMATIAGGKESVLDIEIWGKRGIKEAVLLLEYSHQKENKPIKFYRTISVPVNVSVYTSVELAGCDIIPLPFSMNVIENNDYECWKYLEKMVKQGYRMNDFCLLALDFNNEWNQKMEVDLFCLLEGSKREDFQESNHLIKDYPKDSTFTDRRIIPGRRSSRMLIPIKRINFSSEVLEKRIPSLRNKQFVMDYKTPQEEQKFIRNAFWYRNELLKRLKASWKIVEDDSSEKDDIYNGRFGEVDLRSIRFSSRMVNVLEVEKIGLHLSLLNEDGSEANTEKLKLNTFYTVKVKITNRDTHPITGIIRHIPISKATVNTSTDKKILYNGVLQFSINETISPSCSKEFEIGIVIVERGEYQWGFMFDEMTGFTAGRTVLKQQHVSNEQLTMKVI